MADSPSTGSASWASSDAVRRSMQGNRSRDTMPELAVRKLLHRLGFRYRVAHRPLPQFRATADIVFPRQRVAIFIDGCFWHGCDEHYRPAATNAEYWQSKIEHNIERDKRVTGVLLDAGWTVLRFWSHEAAEEVAVKVAEAVRPGLSVPTSTL